MKRTDPWGKPELMLALSEMCWPTWVICVRLFKYYENNPTEAIVVELIKYNFVINCVEGFFRIYKYSTRKWFMLVWMSLMMSNIACWVEFPLRKPYWDGYNKCFSILLAILLHIIFSKILLKFDNNEYRSVIIIGITFIITLKYRCNFGNFKLWRVRVRVPDLIEILSNSDRIGALIELESLSSLVGEEYKSYYLSLDMDNISERILFSVQKGRMRVDLYIY